MTFDQDKASKWHDRAIEYADILLSTGAAYRIATGNRDLQVGNIVYKAEPLMRTEISVPQVSGNGDGTLTLSLPVDHPIVGRWFRLGVPPRQTAVTMITAAATTIAATAVIIECGEPSKRATAIHASPQLSDSMGEMRPRPTTASVM